MLLTKLQSLRVQEYQLIAQYPEETTTSLAVTDFPAEPYMAEIRAYLPNLPHLVDVEICVLVDIIPVDGQHVFDDVFADILYDLPDLRIDYEFSVLRKFSEATVSLVRTDALSSRSHL